MKNVFIFTYMHMFIIYIYLLAENTGAEVPSIQEALKRHVAAPESVVEEEDSSDIGTSSSSNAHNPAPGMLVLAGHFLNIVFKHGSRCLFENGGLF